MQQGDIFDSFHLSPLTATPSNSLSQSSIHTVTQQLITTNHMIINNNNNTTINNNNLNNSGSLRNISNEEILISPLISDPITHNSDNLVINSTSSNKTAYSSKLSNYLSKSSIEDDIHNELSFTSNHPIQQLNENNNEMINNTEEDYEEEYKSKKKKNERKLASFLEDDSNLDLSKQKMLDASSIDPSLFSFVSENFVKTTMKNEIEDNGSVDEEENAEEINFHEENVNQEEDETNEDDFQKSISVNNDSSIANVRKEFIGEHVKNLEKQTKKLSDKMTRVKLNGDSSEIVNSFITTCANLSQFLDQSVFSSLEDFFVGSCYDISKLSFDEMVKILQDTYCVNGSENAKIQFTKFITNEIMKTVDDTIKNNEQFIEETIKKEIFKEEDLIDYKKLSHLLLIYSSIQNKSIKAQKKHLEILKSEEMDLAAYELGEQAKRLEQFIDAVQVKDQIINKFSKDNENLLSELNVSCQEVEQLTKTIKLLRKEKNELINSLSELKQQYEMKLAVCEKESNTAVNDLRNDLEKLKKECLTFIKEQSTSIQQEVLKENSNKHVSMMTTMEKELLNLKLLVQNREVEIKKLEKALGKKEEEIEKHIEKQYALNDIIEELNNEYYRASIKESSKNVNHTSIQTDDKLTDKEVVKDNANSANNNSEVKELLMEMRREIKDQYSKVLNNVNTNVSNNVPLISTKEVDELKRRLEMYQIELSLDPEGTKDKIRELESIIKKLENQKEMLTNEVKCLNHELATYKVLCEEREIDQQQFDFKSKELIESKSQLEEKYKKLKKQLFKLKNKEYHFIKEQSSLEMKIAKLIDQNQELMLKMKSLEHDNLLNEGKCIRLSLDLEGAKDNERLLQKHSKAINKLVLQPNNGINNTNHINISNLNNNHNSTSAGGEEGRKRKSIVTTASSIDSENNLKLLIYSDRKQEEEYIDNNEQQGVIDRLEKKEISYKVLPVKRKPLQSALVNSGGSSSVNNVKQTKGVTIAPYVATDGKENILTMR
ncbi:hypothetical protein ABK040_002195 [Willaertia magna]